MAFIRTVILVGLISLIWALCRPQPWHVGSLLCFLALAATAGRLKFRLPRIEGTFSLLFAFVLASVDSLSAGETVLVASIGVLAQCLWGTLRRPTLQQLSFNVSGHVISALAACIVYDAGRRAGLRNSQAVLFVLTGTTFFFLNTGLVSGAIAVTSERRFLDTWRHWHMQCLPFYACGAALVGLVVANSDAQNGNMLLLVSTAPALVLLYWYQRSRESNKRSDTLAPADPNGHSGSLSK
jgi:hypothetical protein